MVHVAYEDAEAYAHWAGKELPTEAEWEFAARGGLEGKKFTWGDEHSPGGKAMANSWQGEFPWQNLLQDGFEGTSPVGSFPPNGYGLYDMAGNVWEWTCDWFVPRHADEVVKPCCGPAVNPRIVSPAKSYDPAQAQLQDSTQGCQRRVAPLRAQLLLALSSSGTSAADDRHQHEPHRVPLRCTPSGDRQR